MSVSSPDLAIISIGCSCQPAHQIRTHSGLLRDLTGVSELEISACYFDSLVTPVDSLIRMLDDFLELSSVDQRSITQHSFPKPHPYWPEANIWYVHAFRTGGRPDGQIDLEGEFENNKLKFSYLREKFLLLPNKTRKTLFVLSNAQTGVAELTGEPDLFESMFDLSQSRVTRIRDLLLRCFASSFGGMLVIESEGSWSGNWEIDGVVRYNTGPDFPHWGGDDMQWNKAFIHAIPILIEKH